MKNITLAILLTAYLVDPLSAQVTLAWKFKEGETFFLERNYEQKQRIEVKGKNFQQETGNFWLTKFTVQKVQGEEAVLEQTVVAVRIKNPQKIQPGGEGLQDEALAAKMKGSTFKAKVTRAGRVRQFEGYEEFIQKLAEKDENLEKTLRALLPEAGLRDGLEEVLGFLPETPVQPGATWQREADDPVPPFGSFKTLFRYTYQGRQDEQDTIACALQMKFVPSVRDLGLFRIVKGTLKAEGGQGKILFDGKKGRLIRGEKEVRVQGNLTLETAGNQINLEFTSANRLEWRLREKE